MEINKKYAKKNYTLALFKNFITMKVSTGTKYFKRYPQSGK